MATFHIFAEFEMSTIIIHIIKSHMLFVIGVKLILINVRVVLYANIKKITATKKTYTFKRIDSLNPVFALVCTSFIA
jgi:hypothetical protein